MGKKLCPLLLSGDPSNVAGGAECKRDRCGWWSGDRCSLAVIADGVGELQNIADKV